MLITRSRGIIKSLNSCCFSSFKFKFIGSLFNDDNNPELSIKLLSLLFV